MARKIVRLLGSVLVLLFSVALVVIFVVPQFATQSTEPLLDESSEPADDASAVAWPTQSGQGWPTIYVNIVSHNEDTLSPKYPDFLKDTAAYQAQREGTVAFASMLFERGVKYDFQTDWNFLLALLEFDNGTTSTNGKNLLRYLSEDLGVAIDPHSHEHLGYNYADVAYLIEQLGVTPSPVVGGIIASPAEDSKLEYVWELDHGSKYPLYAWRSEVIWGGGTSNHVNEEDLWISGVWKPKDDEHFDEHSDTAPLVDVGHFSSDWDGLDQLLALQSAGELENGKIYTAAIFAPQSIFDVDYIAEFGDVLDGYADEAADGRIVWTTIMETAEAWETAYDSVPSILHWEGEAAPTSTTAKPACGDGICVPIEKRLCPEDCR